MVNLPSGTTEEAIADAAARSSMRIYGVGPHRNGPVLLRFFSATDR